MIRLKTVPMRDFIHNPEVRSILKSNYILSNGHEIYGCTLADQSEPDYNGEIPEFKSTAQILSHIANNPKRKEWLDGMRDRELKRIERLNRSKEIEYYETELFEAAWAGKTEIWLRNPAHHTKDEICQMFGLTFVRHRYEDMFVVKF